MIRAAFTVALIAGAAVAWPGGAGAQTMCGKRADVVHDLAQKYGETRRSVGMHQGRGVVEVWASDETGTWTIILTHPNGLSCLIAAGEAFQAFEPGPAVDEPT